MNHEPPEKCKLCSLFYDSGNFCAKLSPDELFELNAQSQTATFKRGETIHDQDLGRWPILAISSGVLSLQHLLHDGRKTIAAFFMRGDIIDLRNSSNRKLGSLIALSKVELCKLSPAVFEKIVIANPTARTLVWGNLRDQAFRAINHSSDLAKKQALEKLASFIFECWHRQTIQFQKNKVEIPIRRRELAEYLGMQPETVSRCFKDLEEKEIIRVTDLSIIQLLSVPALRRIANGDRIDQGLERASGPDYKILTVGT